LLNDWFAHGRRGWPSEDQQDSRANQQIRREDREAMDAAKIGEGKVTKVAHRLTLADVFQ
jgi:hypothetical protein